MCLIHLYIIAPKNNGRTWGKQEFLSGSINEEAAFRRLCCIPLCMARMRAKKSIRWLTTNDHEMKTKLMTGETMMLLSSVSSPVSTVINSKGHIQKLEAVRHAVARLQIKGWQPAWIKVCTAAMNSKKPRCTDSSMYWYQIKGFGFPLMWENRMSTISRTAGAQQKKAKAKSSYHAALVM